MPKESAYFIVDHISGMHDVKEIKQQLDTLPGVISVSVNQKKQRVAVDFDNTGVKCEKIRDRISDLGYTITADKAEEHIM